MKRFGTIAFLALAALAAAACSGTNDAVTAPGTQPPDAMSYTGYDNAGQPVVKGWIRINLVSIQVVPAPPLDGAWHLEALVDPNTIGPQVGDGTLVAKWVGDELGVDLNPGHADDNVTLVGKLTTGGPAKTRFEGRWTWTTLEGPKASGTFVAVEP